MESPERFTPHGLKRDAERLRELATEVRSLSYGRILGAADLLDAADALDKAAARIVPGIPEGP